MSKEIVRVKSAPGLAWKKRRFDVFEARWQCKESVVTKGYKIKSVKLWSGTGDPTAAEWKFIADTCTELQQEMYVFERGGLPAGAGVQFDGTIASLILSYKSDPDSRYKKLRYRSRVHYNALMKLIEREYGREPLTGLKARTFLRWHEGWIAGGRTGIAHGKIGILRTLFSFGKTILEDQECRRLSEILSDQRFEMPKAREEFLTVDQAIAVCAMAHTKGRPSIALAQALQFECTLRQKDCVGEWVPMEEPGASDITFIDAEQGIAEKWLRGIRWNEIDGNLVLRHLTSKRQKIVVVDLKNAPMVLEELRRQFDFDGDRAKLPASGPVVISEWSGIPWTAVEFRRWWRILADACGVPKAVKNMDSRAGAITEATSAGAVLEHVQQAATHSNISMTQRYSRGAEEKIAKVMQLRVESRTKK